MVLRSNEDLELGRRRRVLQNEASRPILLYQEELRRG
jgi:hypothetical protein